MLPHTIADCRRLPYTTANYRRLPQTPTFPCRLLQTTEYYWRLTQTTATTDHCSLPHTKMHYHSQAQTTVERVNAAVYYRILPQTITDYRIVTHTTTGYHRPRILQQTATDCRKLQQPTADYRRLCRLLLPETATENRILIHATAVYSWQPQSNKASDYCRLPHDMVNYSILPYTSLH